MPSSSSWWMMLRPLTLPLRKTRMPRLCRSRTIWTAASLLVAQPTMAQNPGMRPSTSWMPQARSWMSSIGPLSFIFAPCTMRSAPVKRWPSSRAWSRLMTCGSLPQVINLDHAREAHALDGLFGEERGDAAVERLAEVGQPHRLGGHRVEQGLGALDDLVQVAELLDLAPRKGVDDRQEVGGVGERDRGVRAELGDGVVDHRLGLGHDGVGAADGAGGDVARHQASPSSWVCSDDPTVSTSSCAARYSRMAAKYRPVSYTHLTLPTNREV